ncbi:hypothetical protein C8R45DRAFT_937318 [Mycena sanguinolenta]|nr:hypothetical protein C8R45DRAFT_937318 [Mycena sanguinolenta]
MQIGNRESEPAVSAFSKTEGCESVPARATTLAHTPLLAEYDSDSCVERKHSRGGQEGTGFDGFSRGRSRLRLRWEVNARAEMGSAQMQTQGTSWRAERHAGRSQVADESMKHAMAHAAVGGERPQAAGERGVSRVACGGVRSGFEQVFEHATIDLGHTAEYTANAPRVSDEARLCHQSGGVRDRYAGDDSGFVGVTDDDTTARGRTAAATELRPRDASWRGSRRSGVVTNA